jgi:hypothetical protein
VRLEEMAARPEVRIYTGMDKVLAVLEDKLDEFTHRLLTTVELRFQENVIIQGIVAERVDVKSLPHLLSGLESTVVYFVEPREDKVEIDFLGIRCGAVQGTVKAVLGSGDVLPLHIEKSQRAVRPPVLLIRSEG